MVHFTEDIQGDRQRVPLPHLKKIIMEQEELVRELNERLKERLKEKSGWGRIELGVVIDKVTIDVLSEAVSKK